MDEVEEFGKITETMRKTFEAKNHDYGNSCRKTFEEFGLVSFLVRLSDKLNRLISIEHKGKSLVKTESVRDTLLDMANYCIIAVMELDRKQKSVNAIPDKMES